MQKDKVSNGRWTNEEHTLFLQGLRLHGKNWKMIEKMIPTRTGSQIRSHAQKYYLRLGKSDRKSKDRKSNKKNSSDEIEIKLEEYDNASKTQAKFSEKEQEKTNRLLQQYPLPLASNPLQNQLIGNQMINPQLFSLNQSTNSNNLAKSNQNEKSQLTQSEQQQQQQKNLMQFQQKMPQFSNNIFQNSLFNQTQLGLGQAPFFLQKQIPLFPQNLYFPRPESFYSQNLENRKISENLEQMSTTVDEPNQQQLQQQQNQQQQQKEFAKQVQNQNNNNNTNNNMMAGLNFPFNPFQFQQNMFNNNINFNNLSGSQLQQLQQQQNQLFFPNNQVKSNQQIQGLNQIFPQQQMFMAQQNQKLVQ